MLKFDNNNIFTGHIKQVLANFNLPMYKIYTRQHEIYKQKNGQERPDIFESISGKSTKYRDYTRSFIYIKDNELSKYYYQYKSGETALDEQGIYKWDKVGSYAPGMKILNGTKRLKIKNNIYDSYTHEYLGDYLRFFRDYFDLNLMPLYNCFGNKLCNNLDLMIDDTVTVSSSDVNYKIYRLPVKLYQSYTIAIDCDTPVELFCGLYGKYYTNSTEYPNFSKDTYIKYSQLKFAQPVLYTRLVDIFNKQDVTRTQLLDIAKNEQNINLFIKVPINNTSTITVLEGDYRNYNDTILNYKKQDQKAQQRQLKNHVVTNYESFINPGKLAGLTEFLNRIGSFKPITNLELLQLNTGESYPFANRLIEYLCDNVITDLDELQDNIKRVQKIVYELTQGKIEGVPGIWDARLQPIIYDFMVANYTKELFNHDIFGFIDKDTEVNLYAKNQATGKKTTLENIDIYDDIYLASKVSNN